MRPQQITKPNQIFNIFFSPQLSSLKAKHAVRWGYALAAKITAPAIFDRKKVKIIQFKWKMLCKIIAVRKRGVKKCKMI